MKNSLDQRNKTKNSLANHKQITCCNLVNISTIESLRILLSKTQWSEPHRISYFWYNSDIQSTNVRKCLRIHFFVKGALIRNQLEITAKNWFQELLAKNSFLFPSKKKTVPANCESVKASTLRVKENHIQSINYEPFLMKSK